MPVYRIADLLVQFEPQYPMLRARSEKYLAAQEDRSAFRLGEDRREMNALHQKHPNLTIEECEYMQIGREFFTYLLEHGGMMLHASAVVVDGNAYLFSAPSGTGKSTHTQLWLQKFGDKAYLLNDDKPALRIGKDGVYAYGAPFSGKYDLSVNARVPVRSIAFVQRSESNRMEPLKGRNALFALLNQTIRPTQVQLYQKLLNVIYSVTEQVPVYTLFCNMDPQAADLSYEVMRKGTIDED